MEQVNGWCFRGIYKGGLWEDDLHVSARTKLACTAHVLSRSPKQNRFNVCLACRTKKCY